MARREQGFSAEMVYLLLFYGVAFILLGFVMLFQAESPVHVLTPKAARYLASFGFVHGILEWDLMSHWIDVGPRSHLDVWFEAGLILVSFTLLLLFATELLRAQGVTHRLVRRAPILCLSVAAIWLGLGAWSGKYFDVGFPLSAGAIGRVCLGFTGSWLAATGFVVAAQREGGRLGRNVARYFRLTAFALLLYGFFAGLITAPAPLAPFDSWNMDSFARVMGFPVAAPRMICAFAIAGLLAVVFTIETTRMRNDWERMRREFISVIAHDLRSPVTAILTSCEYYEKFGTGEKKLFQTIRVSANSLQRMINDLLDVSVIDAAQLKLSKRLVNCVAVVRDVVERSSSSMAGHPVRLLLPEEAEPVLADPMRLEQVLNNLLSNAAKYSFAGTEVTVELRRENDRLILEISNEGPGITPEAQTHLFQRFYREEGVVRKGPAGVGLGLYIVKALVEAHQGTVGVMSEPGRITRFWVSLPIAKAEVERRPAA